MPGSTAGVASAVTPSSLEMIVTAARAGEPPHYWYDEPRGPAIPPPAAGGPPRAKQVTVSPDGALAGPLRPVVVPRFVLPRYTDSVPAARFLTPEAMIPAQPLTGVGRVASRLWTDAGPGGDFGPSAVGRPYATDRGPQEVILSGAKPLGSEDGLPPIPPEHPPMQVR